jgi:hypothetical protein
VWTNFTSRGFGRTTTTIVDANRQAVWAVRRASGSQGFYSRAIVQALEPGDQEPRTPGPRIDTTRPFQGSHLAAAESLLGEVREQSADLDTLIAQLVKRLAHPEPGSNVALAVGYHPTPSRSARRRCGCSPRRPRASCGAAHGRVQHPEPSLGLHSLSVALFPMVISDHDHRTHVASGRNADAARHRSRGSGASGSRRSLTSYDRAGDAAPPVRVPGAAVGMAPWSWWAGPRACIAWPAACSRTSPGSLRRLGPTRRSKGA